MGTGLARSAQATGPLHLSQAKEAAPYGPHVRSAIMQVLTGINATQNTKGWHQESCNAMPDHHK
jgi:hypothetical protein